MASAQQCSRTSRLLPSFFLAGFECATPRNGLRVRVDELRLTGHEAQVRKDYRRLKALGIRAARDAVRWDRVDERGRLDFSSALPFLEAAEAEGITVLWDLFHYGYPDDLDPFGPDFVPRFSRYCGAFARLLVTRGHGGAQRFYTPVNEISFFAWAGGEVGLFAPYATGRGPELKRRLVETAIAGMNAILCEDAGARFVNCDPVVHVVAPLDAPWLEPEARWFNHVAVFEAWDMLAGRLAPELGGSARLLDIVGVNYYGVNQWEHTRPERVLAEDDPRRMPLSALLWRVHRRYGAPMLLSETASMGEDRPRWLERTVHECLRALSRGVPLHGVCIYPVLGMADWHDLAYRPMGLWDLEPETLRRSLHRPTARMLQRLMMRVQHELAHQAPRSVPVHRPRIARASSPSAR